MGSDPVLGSFTGLLLLAALTSGCSANVLHPDACVQNATCRAAFGRGWTCGESGRCDAPVPEPRCTSEPAGIVDDPAAFEDRLLIGSIFVPGGVFQPMVQAARLAVIQVNEHNGLDGRLFGIVQCSNDADVGGDGLDENAATELVATYLADVLGIPGVVGPATSTRTEIAFNVLSSFGTVLVSPSATSPSLTPLDGTSPSDAQPGLLWRTAPPDDLQGRVIAAEMRVNLGATKAAVIHQTGAYGAGLAAVFVESFTAAGGDASQHPFATNTDLAGAIAQVAGIAGEGDLDQVLVISSDPTDVIGFLDVAATDDRFDDLGIFLPDGGRTAQLFRPPGEPREIFFRRDQIRGTVPKTPVGRQVYDTFKVNYGLLFPDNPDDFGFTAHAYDAGWLILYGTAWAQSQEESITGLGMARGLRMLSAGPLVRVEPVEWNRIKGRFEAGESVNIEGASGDLDFDPATEETSAPVVVWRIVPSTGDDPWEFEDTHCWDLSDDPGECDGVPLAGDDDDSAD
jgi:branched-chain amino acid transport system substrate-binding protein